MYPLYRDIRERLDEPDWHDQNGVPRYGKFHPKMLGIYDDWAVLFQVRCQSCGRLFPCAVGISTIHYMMKNPGKLAFEDREDVEKILDLIVYWGDAPDRKSVV